MKVIFLKDVPRVGRRNEIKDQPDGYVRNFLLPKGLAVIATTETIKKLERSQNEIRVEREVQSDLFKKNLRALAGMAVALSARANEKGSLFKAIHAKDIAEALRKEHRVTLDPQFIKLAEPIKEIGTFKVPIEALGISEDITITISSDKK